MPAVIAILVAAQLVQGTPSPEPADIAWTASGRFCEPETVLPLPDDTLLVSNVCDFRTEGDGFLTLLDRDGNILDWRIVDGLDSPLGMTLVDDRLYVIDDNRVRVFTWPGYEPEAIITLDTTIANDIAVSTDHTIYATDTAEGNVVVVSPAREQTLLGGDARFSGANGIEIRDDDLYVGGERLWHVSLVDETVTTVGPEWLEDIDGIEIEADGTLQVTPVGGPLVRLANDVEILGGDGISSTNHGFSERLGLALIPTGYDNTVIAIRLPPRREAR